MLTWGSCSENADELRHVVQFSKDEAALIGSVTAYLSEELARGGAILAIASPDRNASLAGALQGSGADLGKAVHDGRVLFADAQQTLARFMLDGMPDWPRFARTMDALLQKLRPSPNCGIRAYGDMVTALWQRGERAAAVRLEQYWNRILAANSVQLFCAYSIDVLDPEFHAANLDPVLAEHSHVLSAVEVHKPGAIERALREVLGVEADAEIGRFREATPPAWPLLPETETLILWLRGNLPEQAEEILFRARMNFEKGERPQGFEPADARIAALS